MLILLIFLIKVETLIGVALGSSAPRGSNIKKTMTSKKKAKEETEKNNKFDQAMSKKEVLTLNTFVFHSFLPFRAPESPPGRWVAAEAVIVCSRGKTIIFETKCARA